MTDDQPQSKSATPNQPLAWFEGYGIEIEYMLVDPATLNVLPVAPAVLNSLDAKDGTATCGPVAWSNELAAHVLELKTNGPVSQLAEAARAFPAAVADMNARLEAFGARLLPSGMHPWMNPASEFVLYPVDDEGYYRTFDRIFDCRGHGWSNLQSMHVNLPFAGDEQLADLHSAIRLLLPILPALSASSPFLEGHSTPELDHRLFVYRANAARVPSVSGLVVPEHVVSHAQYEQRILQPVYDDLAPLDPEGALRYEWVNARGCIARFDRMALEIRVLDAQECPRADLAVAFAVCETLRQMVRETTCSQLSAHFSEGRLAAILWEVAATGPGTPIQDDEYLAVFGVDSGSFTAGQLWRQLLNGLPDSVRRSTLYDDALWLCENGCLAQRLRNAAGSAPERSDLVRIYSELANCLQDNRLFSG